MSHKLIENVSDTARWVAFYRAMESERSDALFRDPWAKKLAGERGVAIVRHIPRARAMAWALIVRTQVFDELILQAVQRDGATVVLNLAAGFDTRPYRLPLPPSLRWIEVDLPELLAHKEQELEGERYGWDVEEFRPVFDEARRLKREMPLAWLLAWIGRKGFGKGAGVALLERK